MRRRNFLAALATASAGGAAVAAAESTNGSGTTIADLEFYSTSGLVNAAGDPLAAESSVAVWAEDTAYVTDEDGDGDAVGYPDGTPIPLVAVDGTAVGFGTTLVDDDADFSAGNEEFVLNVWDELAGGGTVLWDEGHGQYYSLDRFSAFESYAEENGYDVRATDDLAADLGGADAAVITSPSDAFADAELDALASFVSDGGAIFLHDQSDFSGHDETANLDAVAAALDLAFRFNDAQVMDDTNNGGPAYLPVTGQFNERFPFFADRDGIVASGPGLDPSQRYAVDVVSVTDGDTFDVEFDDGSEETIRVLGVDTPESATASDAERPEEWEGLAEGRSGEYPYLVEWAENATAFAERELAGRTVEIYFDGNEGVTDDYGRLLAYVDYDANGDGDRTATFNRRLIEEGLARVYGSGLSRHDEFWAAENAARGSKTGLWAESDPENTPELRNRPVDDLFFPDAVAVASASGSLDRARVPVAAEPSASDDAPLVALDEDAGVAVVGSPFVDERYEADEGYAVDTAGYENFAFLTNVIDRLSDREGDVLVDGGHGQFGAEFALSNEDAAYYQRYLEGVGIGFEQVNAAYEDRLADARAILVTTPASAFSEADRTALASFAADGGAVVLLGSAAAPSDARANLDDLAAALGSDLRIGGAVTDDASNVNGDASVPTTTNFDASFDLFDAYDPSGATGSSPTLSVSLPDDRASPGSTVPAELSLSGAPDGLAGFDVTVAVDDPAVAAIEDASVVDAFRDGVSETSVGDDGATVSLAAADLDDEIEPGASDVALATVDVVPRAAGSVDVTLAVDRLDADDGSIVEAETSAGALTVAPVERIGGRDLPTDPDGDGLYEDLDGDGELDYDDVVVFFEHRDDDAVRNRVEAYDFNGNGRVDFDDVDVLFEEI